MSDGIKHWGKYRGTVVNNIDPMKHGRIQAMVPAVSGTLPTSWALPCFPACWHAARESGPCAWSSRNTS